MVKICPICEKPFERKGNSKCCCIECQEELRRRNYTAYKERQALRKVTETRPRDVVRTRWGNTLCWTCQNATGKCSWSARLEPVEGWKAKKIKIKGDFYTQQKVDSYIVKKCPQYIKDN